jgi:hypothetical protein
MKVFISWSGELSKQVAELVGPWIEDILQDIKVWISTEDIDKGSIWFGDISSELSNTGIGIICLTKENLLAPWILFEAGALSRGLTKNRVCTLLVNLSHEDLTPPLSQFNGTMPTKQDMLKLIRTINTQSNEKALPEDRLVKTFDRWWEEFQTKYETILSSYKPTQETHKRSLPDIVNEILAISRSLQFGLVDLSKEIKNRSINRSPTLADIFRPQVNPSYAALEALLGTAQPKEQSDKPESSQPSGSLEIKNE